MKRLVVLFVLMAILLVACEPAITQGIVMEMRHEPARRWLHMIPIVHSHGKHGKTVSVTYIPYWHYDDEDFVVVIKNGSQTATYYLPEREFNKVQVGQFIQIDENYEVSDPVIKSRKEN